MAKTIPEISLVYISRKGYLLYHSPWHLMAMKTL